MQKNILKKTFGLDISVGNRISYYNKSSTKSGNIVIQTIKPFIENNIEPFLKTIAHQLNNQHLFIEAIVSSLSLNNRYDCPNIYKINFFVYSSKGELLGTISRSNKNNHIVETDLYVTYIPNEPNSIINEVNDFMFSQSENLYLQTYIPLGIDTLITTENKGKEIFDYLKMNKIFELEQAGIKKVIIEYIIGKDIKWSLVTFDFRDISLNSEYYDIKDNSRNTLLKSMINCQIIHDNCMDNDVLDSSLEDIFNLSELYNY